MQPIQSANTVHYTSLYQLTVVSSFMHLTCTSTNYSKMHTINSLTQGIKSRLKILSYATAKSVDGLTSFIQQCIFLYARLDKIGEN